MISKQFGARPTKGEIRRYEKSPQWKGGKFLNEEHTTIDISFQNIPKLLYKQICEKKGREPNVKLPVKVFKKDEFLSDDTPFKFIWYGHSVLLIRLNRQTILIDPMLGPDASPIAPFRTERFSENTLSLIDAFPLIDIMLLTHDHYDHLDLASMNRLKSKVNKCIVALGTKRHLIKWGFEAEKITEVDWHDQVAINGLNFLFTPSRHFSGRGLRDRAMSLWGGWIMKTDGLSLYFSGDGGYGKHFKEIGDKYGPFDLAWMECGQYNENWRLIHMFPEESVQAGIEAGARKIMPVHWGAFALAQHSWKEPAERFYNEAQRLGMAALIPTLGELIHHDQENNGPTWWSNFH